MDVSPQVRQALKQAANDRDGRLILSCAQAFKIAEDLQVSLAIIGQACDEENIKIAHCQLGCFK